MSDDVLEQLRRENPVPERMPALPIEPVLARLDDEPATAARSRNRPRGARRLSRALPLALSVAARSRNRPRGARRLSRALPLALSVAVVVAVVGVVLTLGGHSSSAGPSTSPLQPQQITPSRVNPVRVARQNARDTPIQLFESPSLRSMGAGFSTGPGAPITPYPETVIPSTARELGTFALAGVGTIQYWTADTRQHGVCGALRLPDGVWVGLQKHPVDGSMPGCWPTRNQTGRGALIIDGFDYITSGVIGRQGQRWLLAYGAVSVPQTTTRVLDIHSGTDAAIVSDNHFVIALHPVGNDWGDYLHLKAFDAAGQRIATQGKPLPGTPTRT
jgi:hypothetical protein